MSDSASSPVKEGDLLAGKYRVERVLGIGGMGIVVAARHEQLDQPVAIKFVRDDALGNEEAVTRFLREARAAVKLRSEHAAKVLDVGTLESGAPYMVMEYLEGSDLGAVLIERGPLSAELAAEYIVQACEAVAEAHAAGIVHRDLKPQNLFLARSVGGGMRVKVLDFGVSKTLASTGGGGLTQTRSMLGSPLYMSPEQMRSSRDVDARSDVWAFGVVLFELLTKRWPYEAETMPELVLKVVTAPPEPLGRLRPDIPQAMVDVVERCLRKDPAERYANAAELAMALEPLAPPESRVTVERARMAMGSTSRGPMVSSPLIVSAETPAARPALTPAAWGSGKGETLLAAQPQRSGGMWIGGGIAVAAVVAGAVFLLRGHDTPPAPAVTALPPQTAPVVLPPPVAPTPPAASVALAPAPTEAAPIAVPAPSASVAPASGATVAGAAWAKQPLVPAARGSAVATPKPKPKSDDIPSLR
jgi:serine/threonine-protein kinase